MDNAPAHLIALKVLLGILQPIHADATPKDTLLLIIFALLVQRTHSGMETHVNVILTLFKVEAVVCQVVLLDQAGMVNPVLAALASV